MKTALKILALECVTFGTGWFLCKKQLEQKYLKEMNDEIEEARTFYKKDLERMEAQNDDRLLEEATEALSKYNGEFPLPEGELQDSVPTLPPKTAWYNEQFLGLDRVPVEPVASAYPDVIPLTEKEYIGNTSGWEQFELTYYVTDDVLVNISDEKIEGADRTQILGDLLETHFVPSGTTTLYVRNNKLTVEVEVERRDTSYEEEVNGSGDDG